jgi:hypothetical protein
MRRETVNQFEITDASAGSTVRKTGGKV